MMDDETTDGRSAKFKYEVKDFSAKSTTDDINARFDADVERFSILETGQSATIDAPLSMQLITEADVRLTPKIERVLDIGCGAGNNTLKLRQVYGKPFASDLLDLSAPMLERAKQRVSDAGIDKVSTWHADLRDADLPIESYDVVLATAVLHHLRDDEDWRAAFEKIISVLRAGGSFWITDLVVQETVPVQELMWSRYGDYSNDSAVSSIARMSSNTSTEKIRRDRSRISSTCSAASASPTSNCCTKTAASPPSERGRCSETQLISRLP